MPGSPKAPKVLVAEDDSAIRAALVTACEGLAVPVTARDADTAREALATESFRLMLLDWQLESGGGSEILREAARLQPGAWRISLFTIPSVDSLVLAMRAGAHDAWWVARGMELREHVLKEWLGKPPVSKGFSPLLLNRMADAMSTRAAARKDSFFKARREFSKNLIREVAVRHKLSRNDLAKWLGVSVRTVQRLLSGRERPSVQGPQKPSEGP